MVKEGLLPAGARFDRALLAGHLALKKGDRKEAEVQLALVQDHAREIQVLERDLALEYYARVHAFVSAKYSRFEEATRQKP